MNYHHLIDRIKEELPGGQTIWLQSATEPGEHHAEGIAITMEPSMHHPDYPEVETTFTVVYFRVYPVYDEVYDDEEEDFLPIDCFVETGYEDSWPELEAAKDEALSLLAHLPRPAFLDQVRNPDVIAGSLRELQMP